MTNLEIALVDFKIREKYLNTIQNFLDWLKLHDELATLYREFGLYDLFINEIDECYYCMKTVKEMYADYKQTYTEEYFENLKVKVSN